MRQKCFGLGLAMIGLLSLMPSTAAASEPLLNGVWIRMNVTGNGYSIDNLDDTKRKIGVFQSVCYMLLTYIDPVAEPEPGAEDPPAYYEGQIVCELAPKVWTRADRIQFRRLLSDSTPTGFAGGATVADWYTSFTNRKGQAVSGYGSHLLLPVITAKGVLRSVSMRSWGEIIAGSLAPGVSSFLGGYQVRGVSVTKVPEEVVAAMPVTRWSEGTIAWPDQACNPELSFGSCDTNDQGHADAWATWVCQQNGFESGAWTRSKIAGCAGETSMYCESGSNPCVPRFEDFCQPGDQTQIQFTCFP